MKRWAYNLMTVMLLIVFLLMGISLYDWKYGSDTGVDARIELLEKQMREKTRPVINIQRATVFNSDGELIIEKREVK